MVTKKEAPATKAKYKVCRRQSYFSKKDKERSLGPRKGIKLPTTTNEKSKTRTAQTRNGSVIVAISELCFFHMRCR